MSAADRLRLRIVVRGRVQGVGFRYATVTTARRLGLSGWARNMPDGNVEILTEGPSAAVHELLAWCQHGPPSARVTAVQHSEEPAEGAALGTFSVRG